MAGEGQAGNTAWAPTLARGIWEGFQEEAPAWPSLRDKRDGSFSHRRRLTCEAWEASRSGSTRVPESGAGLEEAGATRRPGWEGCERGPCSEGHAGSSEGFKQNRWVYFDAPSSWELDGLGIGSRVWRLSPRDQSGHGAREHPRPPAEMAPNDAALGRVSYCVWTCRGSWKVHLGTANVEGREGPSP